MPEAFLSSLAVPGSNSLLAGNLLSQEFLTIMALALLLAVDTYLSTQSSYVRGPATRQTMMTAEAKAIENKNTYFSIPQYYP